MAASPRSTSLSSNTLSALCRMAHITESGRRKLYNEADFFVGRGRTVVQKLSQSKLTMPSPKLTLIFRRVRGGDRGLANEATASNLDQGPSASFSRFLALMEIREVLGATLVSAIRHFHPPHWHPPQAGIGHAPKATRRWRRHSNLASVHPLRSCDEVVID